MKKALIADDHAVVRRGLRQILSENPDFEVIDEVSNGYEVVESIRKNTYDVLILDISMPGLSGLDVLRQVKSEQPELPILILSIYPEEQYAIRVLRDGASGYMNKEAAPDELVMAVKKVTEGKKYISENMAERLAFYVEKGEYQTLHEKLSVREYTVLCQIASGKLNKEIAAELNLSVKTISTYRARILDKMQMKTNAQLIRYALMKNLV